MPINGTDDTVQHSHLRRAYFNLILSIMGANLQEVFYSEKNKGNLQDILQSITHYIANDSLAPDQRFGFIVLNKLLGLWVEQYRPATAPALTNGAPPSPVPGFEQFLYSNAVKLCFEVPLKPSFDYSDAQSFQVSRSLLRALDKKADLAFASTGHWRDCQLPQGSVAEAWRRVRRIYDDKPPSLNPMPSRRRTSLHDRPARRPGVSREHPLAPRAS